MKVLEIEISLDKQKCVSCKKIKTGCYKKGNSTNYICTDCIFKKIKNKKAY